MMNDDGIDDDHDDHDENVHITLDSITQSTTCSTSYAYFGFISILTFQFLLLQILINSLTNNLNILRYINC